MAYNEKLAERLRMALADIKGVSEKKMFGGIAFMANDKMCVGVYKDEMIMRCEPELTDSFLSKKGVRIFDITGRPMKGWLYISEDAIKSKKDFDWWIATALEYNRTAKKKPETKKKKVAEGKKKK